MKRLESILTIGVYGFSESEFFDAITRSGTDCFCDVRRRRGLRGSTYAFANATRLQARLEELDVPYLHLKRLSPSPETRAVQHALDAQAGEKKRLRETLSPAFKAAFEAEALRSPDLETSIAEITAVSRRPLFFCVERSPAACHRSILADHLADRFDIPVEHLEP